MKKLLIAAALSVASTFARAALEKGFEVVDLPENITLLENGKIYIVRESRTIEGAETYPEYSYSFWSTGAKFFARPALHCREGVKCGIFIPDGVTLTLKGAAATRDIPAKTDQEYDSNKNQCYGASPGLCVEAGGVCYIMGTGTLKTIGGDAGAGYDAQDGRPGLLLSDQTHEYRYSNSGNGGWGGAGAAPGIGAWGGFGGMGELDVRYGYTYTPLTISYGTEAVGTSWDHGFYPWQSAGQNGKRAGSIYFLGPINVDSVGGKSNHEASKPGKRVDEYIYFDYKATRGSVRVSVGNCGSSGGGGSGMPAKDIGGGAGGGGGGAAGGTGIHLYWQDSTEHMNIYGGDAKGGKGFVDGGTLGREAKSVTYPLECSGRTPTEPGRAGSEGTVEGIYSSSLAKLREGTTFGAGLKLTDGQIDDVAIIKITFDNQECEPTDPVYQSWGAAVPDVVVPVPERPATALKDRWVFDGYFDENDVQYYDGKGQRVCLTEWTSCTVFERTLTAKWHLEHLPCRLILSDQHSIEVPYLTQTLPVLERSMFPTRDGYRFAGFEDDSGVPYWDGQGQPIVAERTIDSDKRLTAKWTPNRYSVTLACGFEGEGAYSTTSASVTFGETPAKIRVPQREGYKFRGYFDENNVMYYNENGEGVIPYDVVGTAALTATWWPLPEAIEPISIRQRIPWNGQFELTYEAVHLRAERSYAIAIELEVDDHLAERRVTHELIQHIPSQNGRMTVIADFTGKVAEESYDEEARVRLRLAYDETPSTREEEPPAVDNNEKEVEE